MTNEQIIYKKESEYVISCVKYKFGKQASHKYYFNPEWQLEKVEVKCSDAVRVIGELTTGALDFDFINYNRDKFSYFAIFGYCIVHIFTIPFLMGIFCLPYSLIFGMKFIYWHHKTYKFTTEEKNEIIEKLKLNY